MNWFEGRLTTPANTPPTIGGISDQAIAQNTNTGALGYWVSDLQTSAANLTVTASSSNTAVVPNSGIVLNGSGSYRSIKATPAANQIGVTTITLTVSDGSLSTSSSFVLSVGANATAQSFTNATAITIPSVGLGSPYPSTISVTGMVGQVSSATVRLDGFGHTWTGDVGVMLVSPTGQKVVLMTGAGDQSVSNLTLGFSDAAQTSLPYRGALINGTYLPADAYTLADASFTAPAPTGPYGSSLSAVNGLSANGTWSLYVIDCGPGDAGGISGGWTISLITSPISDTTAPSVPAGLATSSVTPTSFALNWNASTDNVGVTGYEVFKNGTSIGTPVSTSFGVPGLSPNTSYSMTVRARDAAGNWSAQSSALSVTTPPDPPVITSATSADGLTGVSFDYQITATNGPTSYNAVGLPSGLSLDTNSGVISGIPGTSGTFTVQVTASNGGGTGSAILTLSIGTNQPPVVTPSSTSLAFPSNSTVSLSFSATSSVSVVSKLEIYRNGVLVSTLTSPTSESTWTFEEPGALAPGKYTYTARAFDADGTSATSSEVLVTILPVLPYTADFESSDGYALGSLDGQLGWEVGTGVAIVTNQDHSHGAWSAQMAAGNPVAVLQQDFAPEANEAVEYVDLFAKPVAQSSLDTADVFTVEQARLAFALSDGQGVLQVFQGDGAGGGTWGGTEFSVPLDAGNRAIDWVRLTTRIDFTHQTWDLYANGKMVAADIPFMAHGDSLVHFQVTGDSTGSFVVDDIYAGEVNPLFADADRDGIDDADESANGMDPTLDDRDADIDSDGLTNVREFMLGTRANVGDTSGDGISDGWAVQYGYDPLVPLSDAVLNTTTSTGLTLLQAAQYNLDPQGTSTDSNGLAYAWQLRYFGHLQVDPVGDDDGDGMSNLQEFLHGNDPTDFYNGTPPQFVPLVGANGELGVGDTISVRITTFEGAPLPNAPVLFRARIGGHLLAARPAAPGSTEVNVRAGTDGVATVYVTLPAN